MFFAFICTTLALFSATLVVVSVCAIRVVTKRFLSGRSDQISRWAFERGARTLGVNARHLIFERAFSVLTHDLRRQWLQLETLLSFERVASSRSVATSVPVNFAAFPIRAVDLVRVHFHEVVLWTLPRRALAFLSAADIEIGFRAIRVLAQDISGVVSELEIWWAMEVCSADSRWHTTSVGINGTARHILAIYVSWISSLDHLRRAHEGIARRYLVAT